MSEMLSQEEIDALLRGDSGDSAQDDSILSAAEVSLSDEEIDALGEIGNISMGTSATTLFTLLNNKVSITTPKVSITTWDELAENLNYSNKSKFSFYIFNAEIIFSHLKLIN